MKLDKTPRPKRLAERTTQAPAPAPQLTDPKTVLTKEALVEALQEDRRRDHASKGILGRTARRFRESWFVVGLEAVGLVSLIFAVGLFVYELRERQDERVARAWQLVTTPASGNSGKTEALEFLNSQYGCLPDGWSLPFIGQCWKKRTSLTGIDLSQPEGKPGTYLFRLTLPDAKLANANLSGAEAGSANLKNAYLFKANLANAIFWHAKLNNADLMMSDLSKASLIGAKLWNANLFKATLDHANLEAADLTGADLTASSLKGVNLSDSDLSMAVYDVDDLLGSWFFEHRPVRNAALQTQYVFAVRGRREPWRKFVSRIMRQRPGLQWTEDMKRHEPNFYFDTPAFVVRTSDP